MKHIKHFRIEIVKFNKKYRRIGIKYNNTNGYRWVDVDIWFWHIDIGENNY